MAILYAALPGPGHLPSDLYNKTPPSGGDAFIFMLHCQFLTYKPWLSLKDPTMIRIRSIM